MEADELAAAAPLDLSYWRALPIWQDLRFGGSTDLTVIVVSPHERGWLAATGIGGQARQIRGVWPTRQEAVAVADAVLAERREPFAWAGPLPPVRILEARSAGWDALRDAGQLPGPKVYGLAEIAQGIGKSLDAVRKMQQRDQLPEPTAKLQAGWIWSGPVIEQWIAQHSAGRSA
jgi:hypothetical protein